MKRRRTIRFLVFVGIPALAVAVLHAWLAYRSTALINRVLAGAGGVLGHADAVVASARIAPWRANLFLEDANLSPRNASADGEPLLRAARISIDASWPATLRRRYLTVNQADLEAVVLRVERSAGGEWNLAALRPPPDGPPPALVAAPAEAPLPPSWRRPEETAVATPDAREFPAPRTPSDAWPPLGIGRLRLELKLLFKDALRAGPEVLPLAMDLNLALDGFSTVAGARIPWAQARLDGHMAGEPARARLEISGRLAPLSDPESMEFDLEGRLDGIDGELLQAITGWDVMVEGASIDAVLKCRGGMFDERFSRLTVTIDNLRLGPEWGRPLAGLRMRRASVPVPVAGTPSAPRIAWDRALTEAVSAAGANVLEREFDRWLRER